MSLSSCFFKTTLISIEIDKIMTSSDSFTSNIVKKGSFFSISVKIFLLSFSRSKSLLGKIGAVCSLKLSQSMPNLCYEYEQNHKKKPSKNLCFFKSADPFFVILSSGSKTSIFLIKSAASSLMQSSP